MVPKVSVILWSLFSVTENLSRQLIYSNVFSHEATEPIEVPLLVGKTKVGSGDHGHVTKMEAMPIYGIQQIVTWYNGGIVELFVVGEINYEFE